MRDVEPVGNHPGSRWVANKTLINALKEGHNVLVELLIRRLRHPVQLAVGPTEEAVQRHRHGEKNFSHGILRMLFLFSFLLLLTLRELLFLCL